MWKVAFLGGGSGLRRRPTKLLYPNHRPPLPDSPKTRPRDRSKQLLLSMGRRSRRDGMRNISLRLPHGANGCFLAGIPVCATSAGRLLPAGYELSHLWSLPKSCSSRCAVAPSSRGAGRSFRVWPRRAYRSAIYSVSAEDLKMKNAIGYLRVSTGEQGRSGLKQLQKGVSAALWRPGTRSIQGPTPSAWPARTSDNLLSIKSTGAISILSAHFRFGRKFSPFFCRSSDTFRRHRRGSSDCVIHDETATAFVFDL